MLKNLIFSLITIVFLCVIFFQFLNITLGGVPLFYIFKLTDQEVIYISRSNIEEFDTDEVRANINWENINFIDPCGKYENGFINMVFKVDKYGFRNHNQNLSGSGFGKDNYIDTDIILLGDSFGVSACVNYPGDLKTQLSNKLNNNRILNLSISGTGPYYQAEMFKSLLKRTNTNFKTLIWLYYEGNDHEDFSPFLGQHINHGFDKSYKRTNLHKFGYFQEYQHKGLVPLKDLYYVDYKGNEKLDMNVPYLKFKLFLANYLRGFGSLAKYVKKYPKLIDNDKEYDTFFKNFNEFLNKKNIENKIIYYIPKYTRLTYSVDNHPQLTQLNNLKELIKNTSIKYNFKFIDGAEFFNKRKDKLDVFHYGLPTHFNKKGYGLLADHLSSSLSNFSK